MVVNNLYVFRCALPPAKTDPPLIVDPDAVLTFSVTRQRLESVSWNCRDVFQLFSVIEHPEFPPCHLLDVGELVAAVATEKLLGFPAAEGPNHHASISRKSLNEDRYEARRRSSPRLLRHASIELVDLLKTRSEAIRLTTARQNGMPILLQ